MIVCGQIDVVVLYYDIVLLYDIFVMMQDCDFGVVSVDIECVLYVSVVDLLKGLCVMMCGQVQMMNSVFGGLFVGLVGVVLLIYLLIVVNFYLWCDVFVIVSGLFVVFVGIVWMLFVMCMLLLVLVLMGVILCMGVVIVNSIFVVIFVCEWFVYIVDVVVVVFEVGFM